MRRFVVSPGFSVLKPFHTNGKCLNTEDTENAEMAKIQNLRVSPRQLEERRKLRDGKLFRAYAWW
jgi:hypothetical protein